MAAVTLLVVGAQFKSPAPVAPPAFDNDFLAAEYYFNHGPDADGTYDLSLARHYFEAALAGNPQGSNIAWYQLGRIDFLEGKFDNALMKFAKQVEYFGDSQPSVYYMIALTYGYRARLYNRPADWRQAEANFRHYLEFDPDSPWARTDLAWVYFSQGKYEAMLAPLEEGLVKHPDNPWLLNMHGLALLNTGQAAAAQEAFEQARESAGRLTPSEWGRSYPGNDPASWAKGLREFQATIATNLTLAS